MVLWRNQERLRMSLLDRFQSQFAAAAKDPFQLEEHPLAKIALVTDRDDAGHAALRKNDDQTPVVVSNRRSRKGAGHKHR